MNKHFLLLPLVLLLMNCGGEQKEAENQNDSEASAYVEYYGNTQGTTFAIICNDDVPLETSEIEQILDDFDLALSSYIPNSTITKLNEAPAGKFSFTDPQGYFDRCYQLSQTVFETSDGAFDPTVFPLIDEWGFNRKIQERPDSSTVDSLRALIGFQNGYHFNYLGADDTIKTDSTIYVLNKRTSESKLGFDAIAQGLAVDVLAEMLEEKGAENYYVEIGGEIRVKGLNSEGELWRIGIDKPIDNSTAEDREIQQIVQLKNRSMATSGSYRKFYEEDGIKYSHTIDPRTGYPVKHSLLSVTVVAESCAIADGMATAFMVMGADETMKFVNDHPELDLEVYLIFTNAKGRLETYYTKNFRDSIIE
ncbi:MAG: FAD:protein FMN transferase [Flavobacteriales bacterium]|nr:FAD:protein FMN transferase [Flavobacteriales bacterium]